jgi:hypothetical protein
MRSRRSFFATSRTSLRGVDLAAHPEPEGPKWRERGTSRERGVFGEDLLRGAEEEQVELVVAHIDYRRPVVRAPQVERERRAGMHEDAVATIAHKKRNGLVHIGCLGAVRVVGPEHQLLAALVQAGKGLPATEELLPRRESEAGGDVPVEGDRVAYEREGCRPGVDHAGGVGEIMRAGQ